MNKAVIGGIIAAVIIAITIGVLSTSYLDSETISAPLDEESETVEEPVSSETKSFTVRLEENVGIKGIP